MVSIASVIDTYCLTCCVTSRFMAIVIEISQFIHNYTLGIKDFSKWVGFYLGVILDLESFESTMGVILSLVVIS